VSSRAYYTQYWVAFFIRFLGTKHKLFHERSRSVICHDGNLN